MEKIFLINNNHQQKFCQQCPISGKLPSTLINKNVLLNGHGLFSLERQKVSNLFGGLSITLQIDFTDKENCKIKIESV